MKLVIISHTKHFKDEEDQFVGWGPTVNELNYLAKEFEKITHIAMFYSGNPPKSYLPYSSTKIDFVSLPVLGGKTFISKLAYIFNAPKIIYIVLKEIRKSDAFQLRTPTGIGVILIPILTFFASKKGWYKYAGNWIQKRPSSSYRFQRWMLKKQNRIVTINGSWKNQLNHCLTYENPCLTEEDRVTGKEILTSKKMNTSKNYCFVGGLNSNKGILKIIDAFKNISYNNIRVFHIIGDGTLKNEIKKKIESLPFQVILHGSLPKSEVIQIYKECHFIVLASKNEGFPKVIGEAMNFGCIPIVSDVSCIGQYVKNNINGYLINPITIEEIQNQINNSLSLSNKRFNEFIHYNYHLSERFTHEFYLKRILKLLNDN